MKKNPKKIKIFNTNYLRTSYDKEGITEEQFQEAELTYNEKGLLLKEAHFNNQNVQESLAIHEYNDEGLVVASSQYDENNELCQKMICEYDTQKHLIKKSNFYGPDSPEYSTHYVYENDLLVREDSYDEDVYSFTEKEYTYNDSRLLSCLTEFDEDGNILYKTENEYDNKKLLIKQVRNEVMQKDRRTYLFGYDENNHKTKELVYNYDDALIAKAYYNYDENGNTVEMEEENLDIYRKTKYTYKGKNCTKIEQLDKKDNVQLWSEYEYNEENEVVSIKNFISDEVDETVYRIASCIRYEVEYFD